MRSVWFCILITVFIFVAGQSVASTIADGTVAGFDVTQQPSPTPTPSPSPIKRPRTRVRDSGISKIPGGSRFTSGSGCNPTKEENIDLSGTYQGNIRYPVGGFGGHATLAITGKEFTLNQNQRKLSGQITAVRTCEYYAVALRLIEASPTTPGTEGSLPITISLRAEKQGKHLWLLSVPGEPTQFGFKPRGRSFWSVLQIWNWMR
jgi:hypothetical protein